MILDFIKGNKYLTRDQQMKRQLIKGLIIGGVVLGVLFALYSLLYVPEIIKKERKVAIEGFSNTEQIIVYKVAKDIPQGHKIDIKEDLVEVKVPKYIAATDMVAVTSQAEQTVTRMNLKQNTILSQSMILPQEDALTMDLRKQDYSHIKLNSNLQQGNFIDVRIKMKNGDDYIVASKKKVLSVNGSVMILNITEAERQYINNATVKAASTEGEVYTTIYVDAENQQPAKITYKFDYDIDRLIKENPNVVKESQDEIINRNNQNNDDKEQSSEGGN